MEVFTAILEALNAFLERITIYFHGLRYALPLMLPYFYGSFVPFQSTTIISSLLRRLLYALLNIFSEMSTYMYDFQGVSINFFKKRSILIFFIKADGNVW